MPVSISVFDKHLLQFLKELRPSSTLDIGVGTGKYGKMCRDNKIGGRLIGVEPHKPYIGQYGLGTIYPSLYNMDAKTYFMEHPDTHDVAIFGDVIEHMTYSEGIDVLHMAALRCRYMIVVTPIGSYQHDANVHWENHISSWLPEDFDRWNPIRVKRQHDPGEYDMLFAVLRGHWL